MTIAPVNNLQPGPINDLPEELTVKIFTEFTPLELTDKIMLVSRTWNRLGSDLSLWPASKLLELNCNVIDEAIWRQHAPQIANAEGILFEGLQPLDHRLAFIEVSRLFARLKAAGTSIEGDKGVTILTMPKGLSINLVHAVFGDRISYIKKCILNDLGEAKADQAYRIIVTKNVLTGSRNKSDRDQQALVGNAGCSLPKVLDVMILALLTEKSSSIRLFGENPWTWTRCIEIIDWPLEVTDWPLIVGGFDRTGLDVNEHYSYKETRGAACVRKF